MTSEGRGTRGGMSQPEDIPRADQYSTGPSCFRLSSDNQEDAPPRPFYLRIFSLTKRTVGMAQTIGLHTPQLREGFRHCPVGTNLPLRAEFDGTLFHVGSRWGPVECPPSFGVTHDRCPQRDQQQHCDRKAAKSLLSASIPAPFTCRVECPRSQFIRWTNIVACSSNHGFKLSFSGVARRCVSH